MTHASYTFDTSPSMPIGIRALSCDDSYHAGLCVLVVRSTGRGVTPMRITVYDSFPNGTVLLDRTVPLSEDAVYELEFSVNAYPDAVAIIYGGRRTKVIEIL